MSASTLPPSTALYSTTATDDGTGVVLAFNDLLVDADEQAALIDWLSEQHHLTYCQYVINADGTEGVLLTNNPEAVNL